MCGELVQPFFFAASRSAHEEAGVRCPNVWHEHRRALGPELESTRDVELVATLIGEAARDLGRAIRRRIEEGLPDGVEVRP